MPVLYTNPNFCPQCEILENELRRLGIEVEVCNDLSVMKEKGISYTPTLEVDGNMLNMSQAWNWAHSGGKD